MVSSSSLPGLDLREVEDVVDDPQESFGRAADTGGVLVLFGVEVGAEQQLVEPDHGVHRRADLVAHGREELRLQPRRLHRLIAGLRELFGGADPIGDVAAVDHEPANGAVGDADCARCLPS